MMLGELGREYAVAPQGGRCRSADVGRLRESLVAGRRSRGWTQEELANQSGVSVRTIRNFEAGVIDRPRVASVQLLLGALRLPEREVLVPVEEEHLPTVVDEPPVDPDPLVGRDEDLAHLCAVVPRCRIVVLTGPGGVGKTRLAHAYAAGAAGRFRYGTVAVQLGVLAADNSTDPADGRAAALLRGAVAAALPAGAATPSGGPNLLLVVDSAEHVLVSAATELAELTAATPGLHVLVTSRRPVPITVARHWEVSPLPFDLAEAEPGRPPAAVELFLRRAEASCPTIDLRHQLDQVSQLCRRLDGIPLAVELAAARIRSVSVETMLRDESIVSILAGAPGADRLPHQRDLSASVLWSYDLLTAPQRTALRQLGAFPGRFTVEDVKRGPWRPAELPVAAVLGELVDASLVRVFRGIPYQYQVIEIVRDIVSSICVV